MSKDQETGSQQQGAAGAGEAETEPRSFTQEQVDAIVRERLARAKSEPPADYEELKAKAAKYDEAQEAAKSDLQKATERAQQMEEELNRMKADRQHAQLVESVARETGVPAGLLHGESEDEIRASASAISAYVEQLKPGHPHDKGGGAGAGATVTKETISQIKNPLEQVRAMAAHAELYN